MVQRTIAGLTRLEDQLTGWMARNAVTGTRISLGIVFLWFGALKLAPGFSPAEDLVGRTILALSCGCIGPELSIPGLGIWEFAIGVGLVTGLAMRWTLALLFLQMAGTVTPMFLFPEEVFVRVPWALSFEGQYIVKNVVLVSSAIVIGGAMRGRAFPPRGL